MDIRKLFGVLVALAVVFAPAAVAAEHMASGPGHHITMMEMGHCDGPPSTGDHDKTPGKSCCISTCIAVAVAPEAPTAGSAPRRSPSYFTLPDSSRGVLGEIATPPPRSA